MADPADHLAIPLSQRPPLDELWDFARPHRGRVAFATTFSVLNKLFEPRYAVIGSEAITASRYIPRARRLVRHSHGYSYR